MSIWKHLAAAVLACGFSMAALAQSTALPSPELFFSHAEVHGVELSPSGRWMAVNVGLADGRFGLAVVDVTGAEKPNIIARAPTLDVARFRWVNEDRLVFDTMDLERGSGDPLYAPGLFSVRRDGSELRVLVKLRGDPFISERASPSDRMLTYNHTLLQVPSTGGDEVIVLEWQFDSNTGELLGRIPKRLNVATGRAVFVGLGVPGYTTDWVFDRAGKPRVAVASREGRTRVLWHKDLDSSASESWSEIGNFEYFRAPWSPQFVDAEGRLYVSVIEGAAGERVLKRFDFSTGQPEAAALVRSPGFDFVGRVLTEPDSGRYLGVRVVTDGETSVWQDPSLKALQQEIDRRLPGRINRLDCRPCSGPELTAVVRSWSDRDPAQYWIWRGPAAEPKVWRVVGSQLKGIQAKQMGTLDFHRFAARDGRSIPVWVTTPSASAPRPETPERKRPAVVLVHGGPWVRGGSWGFDPMAQFLASRGYVVIEPEFRGSTGYGQAHFRAGWKQWGRKMQDDLSDAVAWAQSKGMIDADRVCIAGASYGGYATLMGLVRHPEVFKCGVAWVAVSDPSLLLQWSAISDASEEARRYTLPTLLGDPVADAEMLREISPVVQAARIKAPLLLAYGELDRRVPLEHGTRIRDAMRAAGNTPEFILYDGEGHGWQKVSNRVDFARRVENFLGKHLR